MKQRFFKLFFLLSISGILSYTLYVFWLQSTTLSSVQRITITILFLVLIFALLLLSLRKFEKELVIDKFFLLGQLSIFLLFNLFFVSFLSKIPYPNLIIPTRTVEITPAQNDQRVKIKSFKTELTEGASLNSFAINQGWKTSNGQIISLEKHQQPLVWMGKPGETVEIRFVTCDNCGQVNISWGDGSYEVVDLKQSQNKQKTLTIFHEFPSLLWYRLINLVALEISALAITFILLGWSHTIKQQHDQSDLVIKSPAPIAHPLVPIIALAILTMLVYGAKLQSILFNDDWSIYYNVHFDILEAFMLDERRPLHWVVMWLFNQFLPPHLAIDFTFGFMVCTLFVTAVLVYLLTNQLLDNRKWFAFLFAALFLVFPSDYTKLYLTMANHRFAFLLMLIAMFLSVRSMKTNQLSVGVAAFPLLLVGLLIYEGQLGLLIIWPLILAAIYRKELTWKKVLGLVEYYLVTGIYIIWRLVIQPKYYFRDGKLNSLYTLNIGEIFERLFYSLKTILVGFRFPFPDSSWMSTKNIVITILLFLILVGIYVLVRALWLSENQTTKGIDSLKNEYYILIVGLILWGAGYFPVLLNYPANIYGHLSRINLFSVSGAVLILLSLIHMFSLAVSRNMIRATQWTALFAVSLIFFGGVVQLQTQESYNRSWDEKKAFFQELFKEIPHVKADTHFVFVLEGFEETSSHYRPLFSSSWEALTALRMFYDDINLMASYQYEGITVPRFPGFNILPSTLESVSMFAIGHPEKLIVVRYDRESEDLRIQDNVNNIVPVQGVSEYAPYEQIVPLEEENQSRKIVE